MSDVRFVVVPLQLIYGTTSRIVLVGMRFRDRTKPFHTPWKEPWRFVAFSAWL